MIFTQLTLTDFGIFRGRQTIALTPRPRRPIILFGGKNGAGKSTLLEAIRVCLYGPAAFGGPLSKEAYLTYLGGRIHSNPNLLIQPTFASVSLEFQYAETGTIHSYQVTRSWERRGSQKLVEQLDVLRNGQPLDDISTEHWQDFVRDLIPSGVSQLFFFDGEKIQQLAEDTTDQQTLADSIKSLLGLDVVERLQTDVAIYLSRVTKSNQSKESTREIEELEQEVTHLRHLIDDGQVTRGQQESKLVELRGAIQRVESKMASAGGTFARNRDSLIQAQATLKAGIRQQEEGLKHLCAGLLPFALSPKLCLQLRDQLLQEERAAQLEAGLNLLKDAKEEIVRRVESRSFWAALPEMPGSTQSKLGKHLIKTIRQPVKAEQVGQLDLIHQASSTDRQQLLSWISQAMSDIPKTITTSTAELEQLYRQLEQAEASLRKIPEDDVLKPLVEELHGLHHELAEVATQAMAKEEEIRSLEVTLGEKQRRYNKAVEKLADEASTASRAQLALRAQHALEEYRCALLNKKVSELQDTVSECFNMLCRKKDSVRKITIDPKDFSVTLYDRQNRCLPKAQLSAGEKQVYAISMLWALAKLSGRPLPIIIDTPLARLDSDHRKLLVRQYFPAASHQVIILSTDTEIDQSYFGELRPGVAHAYCLDFDTADYGTKILKGYWWNGADETH